MVDLSYFFMICLESLPRSVVYSRRESCYNRSKRLPLPVNIYHHGNLAISQLSCIVTIVTEHLICRYTFFCFQNCNQIDVGQVSWCVWSLALPFFFYIWGLSCIKVLNLSRNNISCSKAHTLWINLWFTAKQCFHPVNSSDNFVVITISRWWA